VRNKRDHYDNLYRDRPLSALYPNLEQEGAAYFTEEQSQGEGRVKDTDRLINMISRIISFPLGSSVIVVGCGPRPVTIRRLAELGYRVVGIEPVAAYVKTANEWLADIANTAEVHEGTAEDLQVNPGSFDVVLLENVLEHVDSPTDTIRESYRVLKPGGLLYVYTSNRWRFSFRGYNGEYNIPFFNYFPAIVKEQYVTQTIVYEPRLANHSPRPAVHWFSYTDLCRLGRAAGFAHFFSRVDLISAEDGWLKARLIGMVKYNPWLRALLLIQFGNSIFMVRRQ